jgi:putative addiction module component (TIGR02574 family)
MTRQQLLQSARSLSRNERIDLALDLWDSIEAEAADMSLTEEQRRELERRVAADQSEAHPAERWDDLRARLLRGEI